MKISIVGLTPADTQIVKAHFLRLAPLAEIEWLGLDASQADALIFRAKFFQTPTIAAWIKSAPADAVIAAVYRDAANSVVGRSQAAGVHVLDLASQDAEVVAAWVRAIVQKHANAAAVWQALDSPATPADDAAPAQPAPQAPPRPQPAPIVPPVASSVPPAAPVEQFHNAAALRSIRSGIDMVAYSSGYLAYVQVAARTVWANHPPDSIPSFNACQWRPFSGEIPAKMTVEVELWQWLWESLWNSTIDFSSSIREDVPYALQVWPQPRGTSNRAVPQQIAALLEKGPASAATLAAQAKVPVERVKKLLYTLQLVDFAQPLTGDR